MLTPIFARLRRLVSDYRRWEASRLLRLTLKFSPDILNNFIQERAGEMSLQIVLGYLEREGILHCAVCPDRRGPHRKVGPYYACPKHVEKVQAMVAEQAAKAKAPVTLKAAA